MTDTIVVCVRAIDLEVLPEEYLAAARALGERAVALGGSLISWSATLYAFAFDPDAEQEAVELALSAVQGSDATQAAVGMSQGPLEAVNDATARLSLRWGHSLVRATALARAARGGEILLDPAVRAVERGELVTSGSRVSLYGKLRIRGLLLDAMRPWRAIAAATAVGFATPSFMPRDELSEVVSAIDGLALIRTAAGLGGSRVLDEAAHALEPGRALRIAAEILGEPLGALRLSMLRGVNANQTPSGLASGIEQSLEGLLAGEGLDPDSGAELVAAWLAPEAPGAPPGVVLIDDANRVDADTLEVIGQAYAKAPESFRLIASLRTSEEVPRALASIPVALEVALESLPTGQAEELAALAAGGVMERQTKTQWAIRGGRTPLAIVEAVRESIETGEILWDDGSATARARSPAVSGPRPPGYWIRKRYARLEEAHRQLVQLLAVLGGQVSRADITSCSALGASEIGAVDAALSSLVASGWIRIDPPDSFSLSSASHRDTVVRSMTDAELIAMHEAAALAARQCDRPLAAASTAIHYVLAGDAERARDAARLAAAATRAIGLEATAASFDALAEEGDIDALSARNLFGAELQTRRVPDRARPVRAFEPPRLSRGGRSPSSGRASRSARPPGPDVTAASDSPVRAIEALRKGDAAPVEKLAKELRLDEARTGLADRLQAMADLARGDTGDAIRRLRDAADEARRTGSRDRCRALLALSVALAAANRKEEALLEALEALARAREARDERGARACIRFLSQLATSAGHPDVAEVWTRAVEQ